MRQGDCEREATSTQVYPRTVNNELPGVNKYFSTPKCILENF